MWMHHPTKEDRALRAQLGALAGAAGTKHGVVQQRWERDPTWRCPNQHVSKQFNTGRRGRREPGCTASIGVIRRGDMGRMASHLGKW
jgi:hypothetical protein